MISQRGWKALAASAAAAAAVTYGLVVSAVNFNDSLAVPFFRQILIATEWLWSHAHGWEPMSHIRDFGTFYAPFVELTCPLAGFAFFCLLSGHRVRRNCWKPLSIALLSLAFVPTSSFPSVEAARTVGVLLLMVSSVGVRIRSSRATA